MRQLQLFSEFELPIAVRPHRFLNFLQARETRTVAKAVALRRELIFNEIEFTREASAGHLSNDQIRAFQTETDELHYRLNEIERDALAVLGRIEHDRLEYVEQILAKIGGRS